jgi:hypothetical protein
LLLKYHFLEKISNLFFGPFAADVEKLALVCFSFVLFFAESTRVVEKSAVFVYMSSRFTELTQLQMK